PLPHGKNSIFANVISGCIAPREELNIYQCYLRLHCPTGRTQTLSMLSWQNSPHREELNIYKCYPASTRLIGKNSIFINVIRCSTRPIGKNSIYEARRPLPGSGGGFPSGWLSIADPAGVSGRCATRSWPLQRTSQRANSHASCPDSRVCRSRGTRPPGVL